MADNTQPPAGTPQSGAPAQQTQSTPASAAPVPAPAVAPAEANPAPSLVPAAPANLASTAAPSAQAAAPPATPATPAASQDLKATKLKQLKDAILGGRVPQLVLSVISYALEVGASDIHIEPQENTVRVRYRVDGMLRNVVEYPTNMHPAVISRIKIMSNLKIDEQRVPQDGRSTVSTKEGREMDLRISTLPTVNSEKVVMRIQDKSRKIPTLEELGLQGNNLEFIYKAIKMPNGVNLVSGPTGSGKTTTLYSILTMLNKEDVNIMTIEDPVEIQLGGLSQSQVHPDIEYTFATGLRAALRQDPDIIMVGEIRDRETIDVAIEASLTGHLVFSTIHTNSAIETLTRIGNMDVPSYLIASAINTVVAQRLVRKVCTKCKVPDQPKPESVESAKRALDSLPESEKKHHDAKLLANPVFYKGKGCEACGNTGYKGRVGINEVLWMDNILRQMIIDNKATMAIEKMARERGMVTLEQCGVIKALYGDTALEEVYRVAREQEAGNGDEAARAAAAAAPGAKPKQKTATVKKEAVTETKNVEMEKPEAKKSEQKKQ